MPRQIGGKVYLTQEEAARKLGVTPRTLAKWLERGVVTAPPSVDQGLRSFYAFTEKWVTGANKEVAAYRTKRVANQQR